MNDTNDFPGGDDGPRASLHSKNRIFDVISDRLRRFALTLLWERGRPMSLEDLATRVAARECETLPHRVTDDQRRDAVVSLEHTHLPKLTAAGLVEWRPDGRVMAVDRAFVDYPGLTDVIENRDHLPEERLDRLFDVLSDPVRRAVVAVLVDRWHEDVSLPLTAVADAVAAYDDTASGPVSRAGHDRTVLSLHHKHLPKLDDAGLLDYDRDEMVVTCEGLDTGGRSGVRRGPGSGSDGTQGGRRPPDADVTIDRLRSVL